MKPIESSISAFFATSLTKNLLFRAEEDVHDDKHSKQRRSIVLTDQYLYNDMSPVYTVSLYPTDELNGIFSTSNPIHASLGAVAAIVITSLLFLLYDFVVRREVSAKTHLLEAKRAFMRFVSHEVRTPLVWNSLGYFDFDCSLVF